jgi:hypothetical protein
MLSLVVVPASVEFGGSALSHHIGSGKRENTPLIPEDLIKGYPIAAIIINVRNENEGSAV